MRLSDWLCGSLAGVHAIWRERNSRMYAGKKRKLVQVYLVGGCCFCCRQRYITAIDCENFLVPRLSYFAPPCGDLPNAIS